MNKQTITVNKHLAVRQQVSVKDVGKTQLLTIEPGTKFDFVGLITNHKTRSALAVVQAGEASTPFAIPYDQAHMPIEWEQED